MPLAVEWTNLHQILRSLYADMLPLCSDMMGIAKGLAGLGALFFIAYRVWKSLAAAEPIEVFPLLRPFVLGLCIMAFPTLVLGPLNGLLSPISNATSHLVDRQAFDLEKYQTQKDELQRQAMLRDPEKAYLISNEEFDKRLDELGWKPKDLMAIAGMYAERAGYQFGQKVREAFRTFLETLFQAASLTIDTVRTFFLIVLALLGPVAFAFSVYDGFHNTLASWLARYICIYLWLPVSDLFGAILSRIQILMLQQDIERLQDPTFIPDGSNTVYCIFMIIGISSIHKANTIKTLVSEEENVLEDVENYIAEHFTDDYFASLPSDESLSDEENFLMITDRLKVELTEAFPLFSQGYIDQLVDERYGEYLDSKESEEPEEASEDENVEE